MPPLPRTEAELTLGTRVRLGAAYYPEYVPAARLETDLGLMVQAGLDIVRIGESVWSTWQPQEEVLDLEWLEPVLAAVERHDMRCVLGTPTYAVPPWLARKYPSLMAQRTSGSPIPFGHRQNVNIADPHFVQLAERVTTAIVERYRDHPVVIGYQVDNEPGIELLHNPGVFTRFKAELRREFVTVDALNEAWGLVYWSQRLADWDDLWLPDGNTSPAYNLAWRRFQAELTTDYVATLATAVRKLARADQFVTTCIALDRPAIDPSAAAAVLDVPAVNLYYRMQDSLLQTPVSSSPADPSTEWVPPAGPWSLSLQADTARGLRDGMFLVTETNATAIGEAHHNYPAWDGQWRQAAWAMIARGAGLVSYWHWSTCHFGHETYWQGVLGHSLTPGRCYREVSQIGRDLQTLGGLTAALRPVSVAGLLVDRPSRWAMEFQPTLLRGDGNGPDRASYGRLVEAGYRLLFDAGLPADVVEARSLDGDGAALVQRWPLLVAALYVCEEPLRRLLRAYVEAGGHLVALPRFGYLGRAARPWPEPGPAGLTDVFGVEILEASNLARPVDVDGQPGEGAAGQATGWAEGLQAADTDVLFTYRHPHFQQFAAASTHRYGAGRATYLGTLPDASFRAKLVTWLGTEHPALSPFAVAPDEVRTTAAETRDGRRLWVSFNWSELPRTAVAGRPLIDALSGERVSEGDPVHLQPWDVLLHLNE